MPCSCGEPCPRCSWKPWETATWLAAGFICAYILMAILAGTTSTSDGKKRCGNGRVAVPCNTSTSTVQSTP